MNHDSRSSSTNLPPEPLLRCRINWPQLEVFSRLPFARSLRTHISQSLCMCTQIASASAHNASSIFFKLPAELRNDIYSYALSHQHPILATIRSMHSPLALVRTPKLYVREHSIADQPANTVNQPDETVPEVEANQLRFVCKQMWQETKRLSSRYNDIVFWHEPYRPALATCTAFLANVSLFNQRRIRKIVIVEEDTYQTGEPWYDIGQLLIRNRYPIICGFCARNASTRVILRLDKTCSKKKLTFLTVSNLRGSTQLFEWSCAGFLTSTLTTIVGYGKRCWLRKPP
jgi:hypothetical protein